MKPPNISGDFIKNNNYFFDFLLQFADSNIHIC